MAWKVVGEPTAPSALSTVRPTAYPFPRGSSSILRLHRRNRPPCGSWWEWDTFLLPEVISKVQRWLDLIAFLVGRKLPISVEEIMETLPAYAGDWVEGDETARESVRRKFERDKDELRALGIPIETVPYRVGALMEELEGYRILRKDFYLLYLKLLEEERSGTRGGAGNEGSPDKYATPSAIGSGQGP